MRSLERGFQRNIAGLLNEQDHPEIYGGLLGQYKRSAIADMVGSLSGTNPGYMDQTLAQLPNLLAMDQAKRQAEMEEQKRQQMLFYLGTRTDLKAPQLAKLATMTNVQGAGATMDKLADRTTLSQGQETVDMFGNRIGYNPSEDERAFNLWNEGRGGGQTLGDFMAWQEATKRGPQGRVAFGRDIFEGLDPDMAYFVDPQGRPVPLGTTDAEQVPQVQNLSNSYISNSRPNAEVLRAAESIERAATVGTGDFVSAAMLLNFLNSIGVNPRQGADGVYSSESGLWEEGVRMLNMLMGGGRLSETQRAELLEVVRNVKQGALDRQEGLDKHLNQQLGSLGVQNRDQVFGSLRQSVYGSPDSPEATRQPSARLFDQYELEPREQPDPQGRDWRFWR